MKHGISIIARAMLTIALLLVGSQVAYAQPSPDTLQNFEHRDVELTLQTGESLQVYVQSVGENCLVTTPSASRVTRKFSRILASICSKRRRKFPCDPRCRRRSRSLALSKYPAHRTP